MLKKWEDLPDFIRIPEVKPYYDTLRGKRLSLFGKRTFDFCAALVLIVLLALPMAVIALWILIDDGRPVFYRQERVTAYGRVFRIHKFRTMVNNADKLGSAVTVGNDSRVTRVGSRLRHLRLDELPQIIDVLEGKMSIVGVRPEAVKYVKRYRPEYMATLLLPAGITSETSIRYKDEDRLLSAADDVDRVYVEEILPAKMRWNLKYIREFGFFGDIATMFRTVLAVLKWKNVWFPLSLSR